MRKYSETEALAEALRGALMAKSQRERSAKQRRATVAKAARPAPSIYNLEKGTAAAMDAVKAIHRNGGGSVAAFGLLRV